MTTPAGPPTVQSSPFKLSSELLDFYQSHGIDLSTTKDAPRCPYRYVRLNPGFEREETLSMLTQELQQEKIQGHRHQSDVHDYDDDDETRPLPVPWLHKQWGFYALPKNFSLSTSACFRSGRCYGMDVSSGASVAVLLTNHHDKEKKKNPSSNKDENNTDFLNSMDKNEEECKEVRVLDLCCCPGLKLCQMADHLGTMPTNNANESLSPRVKVIGVDISKHRMDLCKNIVQKYLVDPETSGPQRGAASNHGGRVHVQLYLHDGSTFGTKAKANEKDTTSGPFFSDSLIFDSQVALEEVAVRGKRKRMNKSARSRQRTRLRQEASNEWKTMDDDYDNAEGQQGDTGNGRHNNSMRLFDFVLVDAECSTDGSFKHIQERCKDLTSSESLMEENARLMDPVQLESLVALQQKLIGSGFRLLKEGGSLVYSTCSLSKRQNEDIIDWLLCNHDDACLVPLHFPDVRSKYVVEGSQGTVRFYPNLYTSEPTAITTVDVPQLLGDGFFVAKICKKAKVARDSIHGG